MDLLAYLCFIKVTKKLTVMTSTKFQYDHIEVVADIVGRDGKKIHITWRDGRDEWVTKKQWEKIKESHQTSTDF